MVATKTSKPRKRKARPSDQERAADLVRCYFSKEPLPDDPLGIPVDGERLAQYLAGFAMLGTFEIPAAVTKPSPEFMRRIFCARRDFLKQQGSRNPATSAIEYVMETFDVSEQTARDAVWPRKRKS